MSIDAAKKDYLKRAINLFNYPFAFNCDLLLKSIWMKKKTCGSFTIL